MAYRHGVYTSEVPTSIVAPVRVDGDTPFVVGTAPIYLVAKTLAEAKKLVNTPILCYEYSEAVEKLGFLHDQDIFKKYSLCEVIYSQFALYCVSPAIFVNVLDPEKNSHKTSVAISEFNIVNKQAILGKDIYLWTVNIKEDEDSETSLVEDTDYSLSIDEAGNVVVNILDGGALDEATSLFAAFDKANLSGVSSSDIIGGYSSSTGKNTGLEIIEDIYPKFRLTPGFILAPGFSGLSSVAAVMAAKAESVNGVFKCMALIDIPTDNTAGVTVYANCVEYKNDNNLTGSTQIVCWPKIKLGDDEFFMSTHLAGLMAKTDGDYEGTPVKSPSNKNFQMDGLILANGDEVNLSLDQANFLNGQGILTALNWSLGWVCWGNRTACYPGITDPKDSFIPVRRMFQWLENTIVLTYWQKVDYPVTKRLIQTILASVNIWLNGLAAREWLVGEPRAEFLDSENPTTDLIDGVIKFHVYVTPPVPAREIDFILEFDTTQFQTLFS